MAKDTDWVVDIGLALVRHDPTGFVVAFEKAKGKAGGYVGNVWSKVPSFGPGAEKVDKQLDEFNGMVKKAMELWSNATDPAKH